MNANQYLARLWHSTTRTSVALALACSLPPAAIAAGDQTPTRVAPPEVRVLETPAGVLWGGYKASMLPLNQALEILAAHDDSAAVLGSLMASGADPHEVQWLALGSLESEARGLVPAGVLPPVDEFVGLERGLNDMLAGVGLSIASVTTWIGVRAVPGGDGDRVMLLMAHLKGGDTRLLAGRYDQVRSQGTAGTEFLGTFVDEAVDARPDSGSKSADSLWKKPSNPFKNFGSCFKKCLKNTAIGFTIGQTACLVASAIACTTSTVAYPVCFLALAGLCGLAGYSIQIVACGIYALTC